MGPRALWLLAALMLCLPYIMGHTTVPGSGSGRRSTVQADLRWDNYGQIGSSVFGGALSTFGPTRFVEDVKWEYTFLDFVKETDYETGTWATDGGGTIVNLGGVEGDDQNYLRFNTGLGSPDTMEIILKNFRSSGRVMASPSLNNTARIFAAFRLYWDPQAAVHGLADIGVGLMRAEDCIDTAGELAETGFVDGMGWVIHGDDGASGVATLKVIESSQATNYVDVATYNMPATASWLIMGMSYDATTGKVCGFVGDSLIGCILASDQSFSLVGTMGPCAGVGNGPDPGVNKTLFLDWIAWGHNRDDGEGFGSLP